MANLSATPGLSDVYQIETSDPVLGGPGGIANLQAQALLNRTAYILARLNGILNGAGNAVPFAKVEGLGTAAAVALGTAAGNAMPVGAFGLGGAATSVTDVNNATQYKPGFNIVQQGAANAPETGWGMMIVWTGTVTGGGVGPVTQQMLIQGSRIYFRQFITDSWGTWTFVSASDDVGSVAAFATSVPPAGWLRCNGAALSRTVYAHLYARIGTTFGAGDGSTTFNVPDLRGQFVRGWDNAAGVDVGRVFGSNQDDQFASHHHTLRDVNAGGGSASGFDLAPATGTLGSISTVNIEDFGGDETRPINVALLYCIKYN